MIANISEAFGLRFPAIDFFARPTVSGIAARVETLAAATSPAISAAPVSEPPAASPPAAQGEPLA